MSHTIVTLILTWCLVGGFFGLFTGAFVLDNAYKPKIPADARVAAGVGVAFFFPLVLLVGVVYALGWVVLMTVSGTEYWYRKLIGRP